MTKTTKTTPKRTQAETINNLRKNILDLKTANANLRKERSDRAKEYRETIKALKHERNEAQKEKRATARALAQAEKRTRQGTKDPNRIKRYLSAYICFMRTKRPGYLEENPGMTVPEIGKRAGADWQKLSDEDRAPYIKMFEESKAEYEAKKAAAEAAKAEASE